MKDKKTSGQDVVENQTKQLSDDVNQGETDKDLLYEFLNDTNNT